MKKILLFFFLFNCCSVACSCFFFFKVLILMENCLYSFVFFFFINLLIIISKVQCSSVKTEKRYNWTGWSVLKFSVLDGTNLCSWMKLVKILIELWIRFKWFSFYRSSLLLVTCMLLIKFELLKHTVCCDNSINSIRSEFVVLV